jgi:hypothetical protein
MDRRTGIHRKVSGSNQERLAYVELHDHDHGIEAQEVLLLAGGDAIAGIAVGVKPQRVAQHDRAREPVAARSRQTDPV